MIRSTMKPPMNTLSLFALVALLTLGFFTAQAQNAQNAPQSMRFFITSAGSGKPGPRIRYALIEFPENDS